MTNDFERNFSQGHLWIILHLKSESSILEIFQQNVIETYDEMDIKKEAQCNAKLHVKLSWNTCRYLNTYYVITKGCCCKI